MFISENTAHDNDKNMLEDTSMEIQELNKKLHEHKKQLEAMKEQFLTKSGECTCN